MNMRLLGIRTLDELRPEMVDARALRSHAGLTPSDKLYDAVCKSIPAPQPHLILIPNQMKGCHSRNLKERNFELVV